MDKRFDLDQEMIAEIIGYLSRGMKLPTIAVLLGVKYKTLHHWLRIKSVKTLEFREKQPGQRRWVKPRPPRAKFTYYFYVNQAFKRGEYTKRQKNKALNTYYQNRNKPPEEVPFETLKGI